jgi:mannitol-1-/sugar-/sorbitol-6-/2-deoxyglucose-6-phosphatase
MYLNTVIFDMDGLLIDSEPLWYEAALAVMGGLGIKIGEEEYALTVGLRTREFLDFWFRRHNVDLQLLPQTEKAITGSVIEKIRQEGKIMPGVEESVSFFRSKDFKIGLATSSPLALVDAMIERTGLTNTFMAFTSAEHLAYGKPHPQVYLDCAAALGSHPSACVCFEDSFNGMIAAKAARMKCIVVPEPSIRHEARWHAADHLLHSLADFDESVLKKIDR